MRQEAFAQHVARGETLAEAHRMAGYNSNENRIYGEACRVAALPKVAGRVAEIKAQAVALREKAAGSLMIVTAQTVTAMLAQVFDRAVADKQHGAAATAAMGLAKLHGLLIDKTEDVTRRATRDPNAPIEIDVEHWVNETQALIGSAAGPGGSAAGNQGDAERGRFATGGSSMPDNPEQGPAPGSEQGPGPEGPEASALSEGPIGLTPA